MQIYNNSVLSDLATVSFPTLDSGNLDTFKEKQEVVLEICTLHTVNNFCFQQ